MSMKGNAIDRRAYPGGAKHSRGGAECFKKIRRFLFEQKEQGGRTDRNIIRNAVEREQTLRNLKGENSGDKKGGRMDAKKVKESVGLGVGPPPSETSSEITCKIRSTVKEGEEKTVPEEKARKETYLGQK